MGSTCPLSDPFGPWDNSFFLIDKIKVNAICHRNLLLCIYVFLLPTNKIFQNQKIKSKKSTQFQDWSQEPRGATRAPSLRVSLDSETTCWLIVKAAGNRVFQPASTKRAAQANSYEREQFWWRQMVLVRYASWAFQIPPVSKRAAAARLGGAGAIDEGKHFSVAERNPCWTQYGLRSSLPFHDEVNERVHRCVTSHTSSTSQKKNYKLTWSISHALTLS